MSPATWGALLGAGAAVGLLVVLGRARALRRPALADRVLPYIRDVAVVGRGTVAPRAEAYASGPTAPGAGSLGAQGGQNGLGGLVTAARGVFAPLLRQAADGVERVLGGNASVRRRLERAGRTTTVQEFRVEQVLWGVGGFAVTAAWGLLSALTGSADPLPALVLCLVGFAGGVLLRDTALTSQVRKRDREILTEFPTVAELLALAVAAGEGPAAALDRVVGRTGGELSRELAKVLAEVRTGVPVARAFDDLAARTGLPLLARFAEGVAVAVERGTPLADVLHAQAADVREAGRRELIETAARKEVFMMVPVVFLVLPVTVLFAFYPGLIGLRLSG